MNHEHPPRSWVQGQLLVVRLTPFSRGQKTFGGINEASKSTSIHGVCGRVGVRTLTRAAERRSKRRAPLGPHPTESRARARGTRLHTCTAGISTKILPAAQLGTGSRFPRFRVLQVERRAHFPQSANGPRSLLRLSQ